MTPDHPARASAVRHCAILAGGRGSRLGGEKALAPLAGRPLASYALAAAREAGLVPVLVAKPATDLGPLLAGPEGAPGPPLVLHEPAQPTHPLLGVLSALRELGEPLVVCPCDAPLLPAALLRALADDERPLLVVRERRLQPLIGRYPPDVADELEEAVAAGRPARETVLALGAALLEGPALEALGDPAAYLRNVNTPQELAQLEAELGA